jgi:hypothetical protein
MVARWQVDGACMYRQLLNCVGYVWPCHGQVLKGTCHAAVPRGLRLAQRLAIGAGCFGCRLGRCGDGLAVCHAGALKDVKRVPRLRQKEAVGRALDDHAKEVAYTVLRLATKCSSSSGVEAERIMSST